MLELHEDNGENTEAFNHYSIEHKINLDMGRVRKYGTKL